MIIKEIKFKYKECLHDYGDKIITASDVKIPMTKKLIREMWAGMTMAEKKSCLQVFKVKKIIEGIHRR